MQYIPYVHKYTFFEKLIITNCVSTYLISFNILSRQSRPASLNSNVKPALNGFATKTAETALFIDCSYLEE